MLDIEVSELAADKVDDGEAEEADAFLNKLLQTQGAVLPVSLWLESMGLFRVDEFKSQCLSVKTGVFMKAQ